MLCAEYNTHPHPYHHTLLHNHHHGFPTPVHPHYHRPISPKTYNAASTFIRRSRVPFDIVHNRTTAGGDTTLGGGGGLLLQTSPPNNVPMRQTDPRRRILQEEQLKSPNASPSSTPESSKLQQSRRPSVQRSTTEMPYLAREPEEEVVDRPRKLRHEHVHHHHHHHHHHNNKNRSRERGYNQEERHTSSSMDDSFDERSSPKRPLQQAQRPPMIKRSQTSAGSFASGLFKKKLGAAKDGEEPRRSMDRDIDRPRPERRDSIRNHREVTPNRGGDYKRASRESSVNREYAKHHQKEGKGYAVHRESSLPPRREGGNSDPGIGGLRRARTHHHKENRDMEERHNRSYDRHSGEERSKVRARQDRSDREEKPRANSKPREVDLTKAKDKARMEAAHKRKQRRNVLSEIMIHEQKLLEEQNLPPNRVAPQPPKHLTEERNLPPNRAPPQPPKLVECNTCLSDDIPEDQAAKLSCGHIFCNECLTRLFNLSLTDPAHMPPRCCQPDAHIPLKHVDKLLSTKTKIRWNKKYQEFTTANRMYCPEVDCGEWIRPKDFFYVDGVKIGKCSRCKTDICGLCGLKEHGKEECPKDEELNNVREMGKELGWQRCYNCRAMVELEKGCNHMTCRCTAEFCMPCGAKWKTCSCPWFNFEPGEDDMPVPQFDENGRLQDEDLAWEERGRQNDEDERLARQLATDFEEMDNRRERNGGGGGNLWAPLIAGAIGGLLTRTRNLEGAAMERLRRAYTNAIEDDFGWGDSSDESEDERPHEAGFWRIGGPHAIHL